MKSRGAFCINNKKYLVHIISFKKPVDMSVEKCYNHHYAVLVIKRTICQIILQKSQQSFIDLWKVCNIKIENFGKMVYLSSTVFLP